MARPSSRSTRINTLHDPRQWLAWLLIQRELASDRATSLTEVGALERMLATEARLAQTLFAAPPPPQRWCGPTPEPSDMARHHVRAWRQGRQQQLQTLTLIAQELRGVTGDDEDQWALRLQGLGVSLPLQASEPDLAF